MDAEKRALVNLLNSLFCRNLMKAETMRISKTSTMSELIRRQGNEMFNSPGHDSQQHEQIWKFYSMSVAVAESDSKALAVAYGNRSAVLLHLGKFEPSIIDIDRAVKISENVVFKTKLLCRKVKCLNALSSPEAKDVILEAEALLKKITDKGQRRVHEDMVKKTRLSLAQPAVMKTPVEDRTAKLLKTLYAGHTVDDFSAVEIKYSGKYGRHLVATRDIEPGEVIFVEKPYTKFLNVKKLHAYCSHCFKTTWANVPCKHCSWTMFCSEECRNDAWEQYHDLECSVYGCSRGDDNDVFKQLAVRSLILGVREAGGVKNLRSELKRMDENSSKNSTVNAFILFLFI